MCIRDRGGYKLRVREACRTICDTEAQNKTKCLVVGCGDSNSQCAGCSPVNRLWRLIQTLHSLCNELK